jgi:hypothetical protein
MCYAPAVVVDETGDLILASRPDNIGDYKSLTGGAPDNQSDQCISPQELQLDSLCRRSSGKEDRLLFEDGEVMQKKPVTDSELTQELRDGHEILITMIDSYGQVRPEFPQSLFGTPQCAQFRALYVHLDEINVTQCVPVDEIVE